MFDVSWEDKIYSKAKHCNKYPYGELVSYVFRSLPLLNKPREEIRVLELGSGAGNNLWFLSEMGFDVYGVDGSSAAVNISRSLLKSRGQKANVSQGDFTNLDYQDGFFDLIIDREATYCGLKSEIQKTWCEANRVLRPGGVVISFMFSDSNPWLDYAKQNPDIVECLEENTCTGFDRGTFLDAGKSHFSTRKDLENFFDFLEIKSLSEVTNKVILGDNESGAYSEFIILGVKK
jgi:SAM-dependent methyltransferase